MDIKLMDLKTRDLLAKFGAGNHEPGSGSAATYLGLLSAQLLRTVIDLTDKPKRRKKYEAWLPELKRIESEIDRRILPELEELFQTDSDEFDKAINLRQKRNEEADVSEKASLAQQALDQLKPATLIPIRIAKLCIELADFAPYVFTHGFRSARGDAGVAQNAAIAAAGGCLSIIYLNLLSFGSDKWTEEVRKETVLLRKKYEQLSSQAINYVDALKEEADMHHQCQSELNAFINSIPDEANLNDAVIEDVARQLQLLLYRHQDIIWKYEDVDGPLDLLSPDTTLKQMGYQFHRSNSLGIYDVNGESFNVAGIIDKGQKYVQVSSSFSPETQLFTAAHELGHALFHKQTVLHRDRPLDGSASGHKRDRKEWQADKFAACFLMPKKQVIEAFKDSFVMDKFVATENIVFALTLGSLADFRSNYPERRDVSRLLASIGLAGMFRVSVETMAIRLEELGLVEY